MSQLVGKSAEERNAASGDAGHSCRYQYKTAAEVAVEVVTEAPRISGQKVLYAVHAANTAGRAWARLRERFGRDSGATSFTEVFQCIWPSEKPFEDKRREWVKMASKLPQGSLLSSHAIEQLMISELSRHGQPELENHLRLRAPMAWQDIQSQVEKSLHNLSSTVTTTIGHQRCVDWCKVPELSKPDT